MAAESDSRVPFLKEQQNQEQQSGGKTSKSKAFVVDFGDHSVKQPNLQDAFLSYRKGRQEEIRQAKKMKELEMKSKSDPDVMWGLRMRFLDQIKQYFGVPYAKKYWSPEEPEYNSPLFLDCCGLVRQALRDMEDDFNFKTGPWNQAYQYDTLPNTIEEKDMMPGDLVFISATYYNPKSKKQRHDMVHVEVWLGDGPKTIGARWQRGKVQVFDSYDFVAKSYHSQKYIFKSIDTWLMGICKSYCSQHPWRRSSFDPTTKSVFSLDDADAEEDESEDDEDAGDTDDELIHSFGDERDFKKLLGETNSPVKNTTQSSPSIEQSLKEMTLSEIVEDKENQTVGNAPCDGDSSTNSGSASGSQNTKGAAGSGTSVGPGSSNTSQSSGGGRPVKKGKKSPEGGGGGGGGNPRGMVRLSLAANQHPTFYIGGGNGVSLVETPLLNLGWKRITDRHNEYFKLKWTECKSQINYGLFREGEQLVNHIPNCNLLTNKLGLLTSLQEHNRVTQGMKSGGRIRMEDFVPETYRLDERGDKKTFLETYKDGEVWICKPTGMNQGKGIFLISTREEIDNIIKTREEKKQSIRNTSRPMMTRIIQRYIKNPLLLDGHKFDIRAYLHIASTVPYVVLYHKGYIRRTCQPYENDITNLAVHLTNQFVQKKVEAYKENKDDTVWSMEQFNDYINEKVVPEKEGLIENDWAANVLPKLMQKIMMYCFNSVKHKLQQRLGYFELFGFDFMIDDDMRVWLIEVNTNPALHTNCEVLKEVLPPIVEESLLISVECFEKKKKSQPVLPIQAVKGYNLMYHDDHRSAGAGSSLVTGPPIVPRCVSSMQRAAKPKEPTKESVETKSKDDEKEASEVKPSEKQDETNDDQSSDKQTVDTSAKNEQVAMNSSVEKSEKPVQVTSKSFSSITNILTSSSNVSMPNPAAAANAYGIRSRISGTNTKVTKSGWPSFMNKVSPRTLSSGSNPVSLTPVTLNVGSVAMATPISLKMTHAHSANAKTNRHKPIVNRRLVNNVNPKSTRAKSTMEDRSS